eukprot:CAMPEP_0203921204 /NCGR_PEP_ID=MMETSP0359-20131031/61376_1 /ASSEMBLY_ACC=CAM_ASM_000338 /TAXON_ID=268821 /ORGANISM="Scrippsiella Hangoei, Strain SHTV-5" /LENGTH=89 /DNA_ID=CAMNT_0050848833 /DNA_START=206 /DNA_END=472 /DNA_ORIENTATION=-
MTTDILKRPWCAGEVTITYLTHKKVTVIQTPSFAAPEKDEINAQNVMKYLAAHDFRLADYGISHQFLSDALNWVLSVDRHWIELQRHLH